MLRITFNYNWIMIWRELVAFPPVRQTVSVREPGCLWRRLTTGSLGNGPGHVSVGKFPIGHLQSGVKTAETLLQRVMLVVFHQVLCKTSTVTTISQGECRCYCVRMYRKEAGRLTTIYLRLPYSRLSAGNKLILAAAIQHHRQLLSTCPCGFVSAYTNVM